MAKVLHAADFHLDSAFRSLPEEQARLRRQESRELPGWWTGPTTTEPS